MAAKEAKSAKAWRFYDRIVADAAPGGDHSSPWNGDEYVCDMDVLTRLLSAAALVEPDPKASQSGLAAKAIDAWLAYELRRSGFNPDSIWPRAQAPRTLPASITRMYAAFEKKNRAAGAEAQAIHARLTGKNPPGGVGSADAYIMGKNYFKQVDVIITDWDSGPEVLISTKRMSSSFGKNAFNRVEESYGDAKNLRARHPLAFHGYLFALSTAVFNKDIEIARKLMDLLEKLGNEDDAYDSVCLLLIDGLDAKTPGLEAAVGADAFRRLRSEEEVLEEQDIDVLTQNLPSISSVTQFTIPANPAHKNPRQLDFEVSQALLAEKLLKETVEHVLRVSPIERHTEARIRRGWPRVEPAPK